MYLVIEFKNNKQLHTSGLPNHDQNTKKQIATNLGKKGIDINEKSPRCLIVQEKVLVNDELIVRQLQLALDSQDRVIPIGVEDVVVDHTARDQDTAPAVQLDAHAAEVVGHVVVADVEFGRVLDDGSDGAAARAVEQREAVVDEAISEHVEGGVALAGRHVLQDAKLVEAELGVGDFHVVFARQVLAGGIDKNLLLGGGGEEMNFK